MAICSTGRLRTGARASNGARVPDDPMRRRARSPGCSPPSSARWSGWSTRDVGGDFYDLFAIDAHGWAAVIGDVTGRGVDAAGATALARHSLRALAPYTTPEGALQRLNTLLRPPRGPLTAAYARLDPEADGCWATAEDALLTEVQQSLRPGDTVILYTNGVTETRGADGPFREHRLAEVAAMTAGQPANVTAEAILTALRAFNTRDTTDDQALLVLHLTGPDTSRNGGSETPPSV